MTTPIRVLLVEDNEADAYLTRETLESSELRFEIAIASDGVEAIDYLLKQPPFADVVLPSMILLDLNMPRLDGRQVLEELRRHEALRTIPVVVLTSSDADRDIAQSYELGANCYVTKPVGLDAFQSILRTLEGFWFSVAKLPR